MLRYLLLIPFLRGKSRLAIDVETVSVATAFAEYHVESALMLVPSYDKVGANYVNRIAEMRKRKIENGEVPNGRDISRQLGKTVRQAITPL